MPTDRRTKWLVKRSLLPLAILCLAACGKWEQESASLSPDGRVRAVVEHNGSGACCSDHSRLSLLDAKDGTLTDPGVAVEATNASIKARWTNDDLLVVEACGATKVAAKSRMLREPVVEPDGSMNEVRIEVITSPVILKSGASYCLKEAVT